MEDPKIGISTQTLVSNAEGSHKARKVPQYVAALSVTLGAFALGNVLAWTSPASKPLKQDGYSDQSWIGAAMALGAAAVVMPIGIFMDKFGRKWTMLGLVVPFVGGWLLIVFADSLAMYISGRFIVGMMGGAFSLTAPVYTSEIAQSEIRGQLGSFFQLMVTIGILFVYVLGGAEMELQMVSIVCCVVPAVFGVIFFFMPETPMQFLRWGKESDARNSLQWFRGPEYDIEFEIREMKEALDKAEREKLSFKEAFSTTAAKKGMIISMGLMLFQQLSGVNAVIFYAGDIFLAAGSTMDPNLSAIIVGAVQVAATFVSSMVVDQLGRRVLLLLSDSVMAICSLLLGIFFYLKDSDEDVSSIGWLPLTSLCVFVVVFSLGYGPIPWMIFGELFAPQIKGFASSIACLFNWILAFCVTKFFSDLVVALGNDVTFWIFCGISTLGTVFVFFVVPETKGKSLEEIQRELSGDSSVLPTAPVEQPQRTEWPLGTTEKY